MTQGRVLVVDDTAFNRRLLVRLLTSIGHETLEAVNGREALERLIAWTEPARSRLGIEVDLPDRNGAERSRDALAAGSSIEEIYREAVAETKRTYKTDVSARR